MAIGSRALRRAKASLPVPAEYRYRLLVLTAMLIATPPLHARAVTVSVFGLFHPQELVIRPVPGERLVLSSGRNVFSIEGDRSVRFSRRGSLVAMERSGVASVADVVRVGAYGSAGRFALEVPGKIQREFAGRLAVRAAAASLEATVEMDLETAVAAIVAAEAGDLAAAALDAQAVATRSYLTASMGRHSGYQFCDTTHCQYLAGPPPPDSPASRAADQTRGLVLAYRGIRFAPLYSRSCGGATRTPSDVGLSDGAYRYQRVRCPVCSRKPSSWSATRPATELAAIVSRPGDEGARLQVVRELGWSVVPGNHYEIQRNGDAVRIEGSGEGHGVGLCQRGAAGLANEGWSFTEILAHYLPDSSLVQLPPK